MRKSLAAAALASLLMIPFLTACQGDIPFTEITPGLSYVDSTLGQGETVEADDFVMVHYSGWLFVEGEKAAEPFDSSVARGEPVGFPLGKSLVIQGWDKGLPGMKVGGKRTLLIAPEMGFGERGAPPAIPPAATLMFDVEVMGLPEVVVDTTFTEGTGPVAEPGDKIDVHYTGWLWENGAKGAEFDSSHKRNRPYSFILGAGRVIAGWDIGLDGMKVGTKVRLIIPPEMGYGSQGSGANIPPNSTLCFEVELMGIQGKE